MSSNCLNLSTVPFAINDSISCQIKRPYFHVKPLERSQLKNWRDYLDFEIQQGSHERVIVLFERCMIATALYEDFWLKVLKLH